MNQMSWQSVAPGRQVHVASPVISDQYNKDLHSHDFYELFLVESGRGLHLLPSGPKELLPGDLVYVADRHEHSLRADSMQIINIAFPASAVQPLFALCPRLNEIYSSATPVHGRSSSLQRERLHYWAQVLRPQSDPATSVQAMLLDLVRAEADDAFPEELPTWLSDALQRMSEPPYLAEGMSALVALCKRSREYIWRTCKKSVQRRPQDLINDLRMAFAERRLRLSSDSILSICYDCGLSNISHFYRLFRAHFGKTPKQYRQQYQESVT